VSVTCRTGLNELQRPIVVVRDRFLVRVKTG
jgi:hypothetical protein